MRGRLESCTIGTHSVNTKELAPPRPFFSPWKRVCFAVAGTGATRRGPPRERPRRGAWIFSREPLQPSERDRFRFVSATLFSLLPLELSRFRAIPWRGCIETVTPRSFRRLRFDVFSRTPVAARSLSLTLEPYAG